MRTHKSYTEVGDRTLSLAQSEAPQFHFWSWDVEEWPHETRPNRIIVTLYDDVDDDEIEVVIDSDAKDSEIVKQIWREIAGRSQAAAEVEVERRAERSALACDR